MVEDDETGGEEDDDGDAFGLENAARERDSKKSPSSSETDKKLIEDYQSQVAELREKLDTMEDTLKRKDDELNGALNTERSRAATLTTKEREFSELRISLEKLERENQELRAELDEQQRVTDEVRQEAQEFLREMRMLSERSGSSYEKEEQLTNTIHKLEEEVRDWRNRYARTKTQLRTMRAGSIGLTIQPDVAKFIQDSGFTEENGLVKDVHVTKFQISIDELLRVARTEEPAKVIDFMKIAVVNVRNITQDIDQAQPATNEMAQLQAKLKARVSATANNLITASKNFASANGLSPVSILDAAVSHLTASVVELVRTVKIRPTPVGELEDDDDGNLDPVDSTGFFPVRDPNARQENNPPPFQGLRNGRMSAESSMYSPLNSPRESAMSRPKSSKATPLVTPLANGFMNGNKMPPPAPMGTGFGIRTQDTDVEDLKIYLEDQTASLVQNIQSLVTSIRSDAGIKVISGQIKAIAENVGNVVSSTEEAMSSTGNGPLRSQSEPVLKKLSSCRERLLQAGETGQSIANAGRDDEEGERAWRAWNQSLPPLAFEIARETKELVLRVDVIDGEQQGRPDGTEDYS
ncbi:putative protein SPA2 [Glarea lozoyensis 74030]|uniref:Cell polarity protein n=1 Tax=Glarea lozoyensis (strain ATCC 74030 / MF5533) TaxID=1104152 RepID=H0EH63_GLAL7|nr:putative protein SPA2 [Glarea lozoyensis 74030]